MFTTYVSDALQELEERELDESEKFTKLLTIINSLVTKNIHGKQFMLSAIKNLSCSGQNTTYEESKMLYNIVNLLMRNYKCNESELQSAFANVYVTWFKTNLPDTVRAAKYLGDVRSIGIFSTVLDINTAISDIESLVMIGIERVGIVQCLLKSSSSDDAIWSQKAKSPAPPCVIIREFLAIADCKFEDENSFVNAITWGTSSSCEQFGLLKTTLTYEWWWKFAKIIEKQRSGCKVVCLSACSPALTQEMQMMVGLFIYIMLIF